MDQGRIPEIDVDAAAQRLSEASARQDQSEGRPLLVDVREADELAVVHVPGALHVPMSDFVDAARAIPPDRPLLVMCATGRRSLVAADYLRRNGYADVANVSGGIVEWSKRGLPTSSGPLRPR